MAASDFCVTLLRLENVFAFVLLVHHSTGQTNVHYRHNESRTLSYQGISYNGNSDELREEIDKLLQNARFKFVMGRAIIVPHANLNLSGTVAASGFRQIQSGAVHRIFIIAPSHHFNFKKCMLSPARSYATPFDYEFEIDQEVYARLLKTGRFEYMDIAQDELEHSIEDVLHIIARLMDIYEDKPKIVPIITGDFSFEEVAFYGELFADYLKSRKNLFIISTDFCHWGKKYNYLYINQTALTIMDSIRGIDKIGMDIIEQLDPVAFDRYIGRFKNTICGEEGIRILIHTAVNLKHMKPDLKFIDYKISNEVRNVSDICVTYAAASLIFRNESYMIN